VLLALAAAALADDESALYFLGRAKEALAAGDLDKAAEFLQKSAKEKEGYAPTLLAFAELARKRGDKDSAVRNLEECLALRKRDDLSARELEAILAAENMLGEIDGARVQLRKLVADHIRDLVKLANATKDEEVAKASWRSVLLLDPDHAGARAALAGGRPASPPSGTPLFNGKDLSGWIEGRPAWTVADGVVKGRMNGANVQRTEEQFKGAYTIVCEMRVRENVGEEPLFAILVGIKNNYDHFGLYLWPENFRLERKYDEDSRSDLATYTYKRLSEKFNLADWHTYRIDVEGKRIRCSVDDREVADSGAADRDLEGPVGFWLQDISVEIRRFTLEQR
jgi:tetratricopeptide (TPR) repeat protein